MRQQRKSTGRKREERGERREERGERKRGENRESTCTVKEVSLNIDKILVVFQWSSRSSSKKRSEMTRRIRRKQFHYSFTKLLTLKKYNKQIIKDSVSFGGGSILNHKLT